MVGTGPEKDDGPFPVLEEPGLELAHSGEAPCGGETPYHHGKRLRLAPLAAAEFADSGLVRRVASEVIATEATDGDNATLLEQPSGPKKRR
jgi:hypothetical protein